MGETKSRTARRMANKMSVPVATEVFPHRNDTFRDTKVRKRPEQTAYLHLRAFSIFEFLRPRPPPVCRGEERWRAYAFGAKMHKEMGARAFSLRGTNTALRGTREALRRTREVLRGTCKALRGTCDELRGT